MPIYEYICTTCRHEFEVLARSMSASGPVSCPACDSESTERRLSVFAARRHDMPSLDIPPGGCSRCGDPSGPCDR